MTDSLLRLGLVGHPVSHSISPKLHQAALQYSGIAGSYELFDIAPAELEQRIQELLSSGLRGFNVTIPHKKAVLSLVDQLSPEAKLIGAVNTVAAKESGSGALALTGYNTDAIGLLRAIENRFVKSFKNGTALLLGYGGSAQAVLVALIQLGVKEIQVAGRNQAKIEQFISEASDRIELVKHFGDASQIEFGPPLRIQPLDNQRIQSIDIAVNTVPWGLTAGERITTDCLPGWLVSIFEYLPSSCSCVDLVYRQDRKKPPFTQAAFEKKLAAQDGVEMLIEQAREAFFIWTGKSVPAKIMKAALLERHNQSG
jgi:shikimate dehydrogenase